MLSEKDIRHLIIHGLGVEGRAALDWFLTAGIQNITLIDTHKKIEAIPATINDNASISAITEKSFTAPASQDSTLYLRSPGVAPDNPVFATIRERRIAHTTPTGWWLATKAPKHTITITGTKGKSSTASLTAHILRWAGRDAREMGNIGRTPFEETVSTDTICVFELSSFMMHDLPPVQAFHAVTNIFREHTDWHGTHAAYRHDKLRPFLKPPFASGILPEELKPEASANASDLKTFAEIAPLSGDTITLRDTEHTITPVDLHPAFSAPSMLLALRAGIAICLATGLLTAAEVMNALRQHLPGWPGLPSRQYITPSTDGITYVDDALATVPEATLSALTRWQDHPIHLLLGGADRGQDFKDLMSACTKRPDITLYAFSDTSKKMRTAAEKAGLSDRCTSYASLEDMISAAFQNAQKGDVVLFSPAAPSAPPHTNFAERSTIFKSFVPQG